MDDMGEDIFFIPFRKGNGTVINWEDMPLALCFNWHQGYGNNNYAVTSVYPGKKTVLLHRLLLDFPKYPENEVDHIDGNKLNNLRSNLRVTDKYENQRNKEAHRNGKLHGGYYRKDLKKWQAQAKINGVNRYIGLFKTEEEMHKAYHKFVGSE